MSSSFVNVLLQTPAKVLDIPCPFYYFNNMEYHDELWQKL